MTTMLSLSGQVTVWNSNEGKIENIDMKTQARFEPIPQGAMCGPETAALPAEQILAKRRDVLLSVYVAGSCSRTDQL